MPNVTFTNAPKRCRAHAMKATTQMLYCNNTMQQSYNAKNIMQQSYDATIQSYNANVP